MAKRIILILVCLSSAIALADQPMIKAKNLQFDPGDDEYSVTQDTNVSQTQQLLGRVEVLEHNLAKLQQKVETMSSGNEAIDLKKSTPKDSDDVFDVPKATDVTKNASTGSANPESNIQNPNKSNTGEKNLYDIALADFKDGKFEEAEEQFSTFIKKYPKSNLQSNAHFWHGETFFKRNMFDKAAISYLKGYKQFPKGAKAADSLLKLAISLGSLKKKSECCAMLAKLESEFPNRPVASVKRSTDAKLKYGCK